VKTYHRLDAWGVLGLTRDASSEEVRSAYERLASRLAPGALAYYSIADREEQEALHRRLRSAYLELLDELGAAAPHPSGAEPAAAEPAQPAAGAEPAAAAVSAETGACDGALLRRTREAKGLAPEALSQRTRIRRHLLEALEAERFAELPERVFVRGFVVAVARELGLDPERTWAEYGARFDAWAAAHR